MSDCKIGFHLINSYFDGEICTALESLNFALHIVSGSDLGRLEGSVIDQEMAITLDISFFVALLLVGVIVGVAWGFANRLNCTTFGSVRERTTRGRLSARGFCGLGQRV